ncbi:MAG: hypothetical protein XD50_0704 [Clostridia bacterium 41_269]|nr:MAG: hypothetical protein XD50_0704 [Clostridia bacterium 41_269]
MVDNESRMEEENIIVLTDEEGNEHEFEVLDILEIDDNEYAILLPLEDNEEEEAIILRTGLDENGEEILYEIEDDDEWEMVAETWQKLVAAGDNGEAF